MTSDSKNQQNAKIRILILTPHRIIQESLQVLIEENRDMQVLACISEAEKLLEYKDFNNLDVILIYLIDGDSSFNHCSKR